MEDRQYPAVPLATKDVQADVSVMVMKQRGGYELSLEYRTDLYCEETARGLLQRLYLGGLTCGTLHIFLFHFPHFLVRWDVHNPDIGILTI